MASLAELITSYPSQWQESGRDTEGFLNLLVADRIITWDEADQIMSLYELTWSEAKGPEQHYVEITGKPLKEGGYLESWANSIIAVMRSFWEWLKDKLLDFFKMVWSWLEPVVADAWAALSGKFHEAAIKVHEYVNRAMEALGVVTPERAVSTAASLYMFAFGAGVTAHLASVITEGVYFTKNLGLHQTAAMLGDFAGFGRIAGATIGVVESRVLGQAMTYAWQQKCRPVIHDIWTLRDLAVKREIDGDKFRHLMGFHGLQDEYISDIERVMYREPSYRELGLMVENADEGDDWLNDKLKRCGYDDKDADILTRTLVKRAMSQQRTSYHSQAFYLYREGYIDKERYHNMLTWLGLRPAAISMVMAAADLAYLYDMTKDLVTYYVDSYKKDMISKDELLVSLIALGIVPQRASLLVRKAHVSKTPKPTVKVDKTAETAAAKLQQLYVTLYIAMFRKGLIDQAALLQSLLAIGLVPDLAEVTVQLELVRALPAPASA